MEVLFAIGVLTIGLLGVAHILPVATNNAANALKTDRTVEEVNNRVATDLAELRGSFESVIVAENSLTRFDVTRRRYREVNTASFGAAIAAYEARPALVPDQPNLPDAFCIDPWFLSAAATVRDDDPAGMNPDTNRNGYDRTMFPCFDPRYHPISFSPSASIASSSPLQWDGPRFTRVSLSFDGSSGFLSSLTSRASTLRADGLSIVHPEDSSRPPGIFVQRSGNGLNSLARNTVSSNFSSIVMMSRIQQGSNLFNAAVVTMEDRQVVTVPNGGALAHQLTPHTVFDPSIENQPPPDDAEKLFPGEQLGYVSFADRPFGFGGGGEFTFRTNAFVKPDVGDNDWIMLMRRDYHRVPDVVDYSTATPSVVTTIAPTVVPGALHFAWYRIADVVQEPTLDSTGSYFQTTLSVRGPDWIFHPIQTVVQAAPVIYGPPYYGLTTGVAPAQVQPQPTWGTPPSFNLDNMPARGAGPAPNVGSTPLSAFYEHQDYGTFVVIMPDVVSVRQFQVQL